MKEYQELVNAKIWIDSLNLLVQQREELSKQIKAYKERFYKLSSQSAKRISDAEVEEYQLTLENYERRQTELDKLIKPYNKRIRQLLGAHVSYYEDYVRSAYAAFESANERLVDAKVLTGDDMLRDNRYDTIFTVILTLALLCVVFVLIPMFIETYDSDMYYYI